MKMLKSLHKKRTLIGLFLFAICVLSLAEVQNVSAYNAKAHSESEADWWGLEGFSWDAIERIQVYNTIVDLATTAEANIVLRIYIWFDGWIDWLPPYDFTPLRPYSHEVSSNLKENAHFQHCANYSQLKHEWSRLENKTYKAVKLANQTNDVRGLLAIIGMSTHTVQDFYAHSNWADLTDDAAGSWGRRDATWFDVNDEEKEMLGDAVYSDHKDAEHDISHDMLNKDYFGREHYETSYREAYYATVQWVELIKSWVKPELWEQAKAFTNEIPGDDTCFQLMQITWWAGAWTSDYSEDYTELMDFFLVHGGWMHDELPWPEIYFGTFMDYARIVYDQTPENVDHVSEYKFIPEVRWLRVETMLLRDVNDNADLLTNADMFTIVDAQVTNHYEAYWEDQEVLYIDWVTLEPIRWNVESVPIRYWVYDEDNWDDWEMFDVSPTDEPYWSGSFPVCREGYSTSYNEYVETQGTGDGMVARAEFWLMTFMKQRVNIAPSVTMELFDQPNPAFILPVVDTLTFHGSFTDVNVLDSHTATWDFGDGTVASGTLTEGKTGPEENIGSEVTGVVTASHAYSNPGTYTVTLTVTDDDGGFDTATTQVTIASAEEVNDIIDQYTQDLADTAFKNNPAQRKKAFSNMFAEIAEKIENEEWNDAIKDLTNNIRAKADGFVDGNPKDDWIIDPVAQQEICMMIDELVAYLKTFL